MTELQITEFKSKFATIVSVHSAIKKHALYIRDLHAWDKNDSHKNAILRALKKREELKSHLNNLMQGNTYDELCIFSKKLSALRSRLKQSRTQKDKIQLKIDALKYPFN